MTQVLFEDRASTPRYGTPASEQEDEARQIERGIRLEIRSAFAGAPDPDDVEAKQQVWLRALMRAFATNKGQLSDQESEILREMIRIFVAHRVEAMVDRRVSRMLETLSEDEPPNFRSLSAAMSLKWYVPR